MKKYLLMSSAAVLIGVLRVKGFQILTSMTHLGQITFFYKEKKVILRVLCEESLSKMVHLCVCLNDEANNLKS